MKVLMVHNHYRSGAPSGESIVFDNERKLLLGHGVEVVSYERHNDDIDDSTLAARAATALGTTWSLRSRSDVAALLREHRPDVAHFHNTFPLVSPSVYAACHGAGVPVVQTLHNFRLVCAAGILQRDGRPCEDCVGGFPWPALRHRCYRDSRVATAAVVGMLAVNRAVGSYSRGVDRYVVLTEFARSVFERAGLAPERLTVKPNFYAGTPVLPRQREAVALFAGRLSAEKGVRTLLEAWRDVRDCKLRLAGDGPLRAELEEMARREGLAVEFLGLLPPSAVAEQMARARFQVVPSEWYEGFPMVVVEAYAHGAPVLASRLGSLAEIVVDGRTGRLFRPGDIDDLRRQLLALRDPAEAERLGRGAREAYEQKYTAERNLAQLLDIYRAVVGMPREGLQG